MNYIKFFWKPILWGLIVILLSAIDTTNMSRPWFLQIPNLDKIVHFTLYCIFTFLLVFDLQKSGVAGKSAGIILLLAFSAAVLFGGGMEIMQMIPAFHRDASISDFYANMAGSAAAVLLFIPVNRIKYITKY